MKKIAYSFISPRQLSVQEAVHNVLPELWLRKCSPRISFINTNLPNNRIRMIKSNEELELLPETALTYLRKAQLIGTWIGQHAESFASLKIVCFAQFVSLYYKKTSQDNDYQPKILEEKIENENDCNTTLPKKSF